MCYLHEVVPPQPTRRLTIQALADEAQRQLPDPGLWARVMAAQEWTVWTDGSVKDSRGGFAVVLEAPDAPVPAGQWHAVLGAYDGPCLLPIRTEALAAIPGSVALTIRTDSLVGVNAYGTFVTRRRRLQVGPRRKHPDASGAIGPLPDIAEPPQSNDGLRDGMMEVRRRSALDGGPESDGDDERMELRLLHVLYSDLSERRRKLWRERDSQRAAFHVKLLLDVLPTLARMRLWQPHVYPDGNCRRCNAGVDVC